MYDATFHQPRNFPIKPHSLAIVFDISKRAYDDPFEGGPFRFRSFCGSGERVAVSTKALARGWPGNDVLPVNDWRPPVQWAVENLSLCDRCPERSLHTSTGWARECLLQSSTFGKIRRCGCCRNDGVEKIDAELWFIWKFSEICMTVRLCVRLKNSHSEMMLIVLWNANGVILDNFM